MLVPMLLFSLALMPSAALASESTTLDFDADAGDMVGGEVEDGVLRVTDGTANLALGALDALTAELVVRKVDGGAWVLNAGDQSWIADYGASGGLRLDGASLPFPHGHRTWQTESSEVFGPSMGTTGYWQDGSTLHCEVVYDDSSASWYLYYTGVIAPGYGYRQIGVLTSTDGETWSEYSGNPVLTIDYDLTAVDGVHVHMPTVVIDPSDATWHMFYSCYQNDVGNRICHATSDDGLAWSARGVALDRGASGAFDSASLREPDAQIDDGGTWHMFYQGTKDDEHYGPTGYATSADGETWTKLGEVAGSGESALQGGGVLQSPYGLEQWYNCDDAFCYASADPVDWATWAMDTDPALTKDWATWNSGYIQAPSPWLVDTTYHMWFNAYDYGTGLEVLGHAATAPEPGAWATVALDWDGETLTVSFDGGPGLTATAEDVQGLTLTAVGVLEVDTLSYTATATPTDTGGDSGTADTSASGDDSGASGDSGEPAANDGPDSGAAAPQADAGCGGCQSAPVAGWWWVALLVWPLRFRRG
jgi:hypothetical protein